MDWQGPPTTKEDLEKTIDELRTVASLLHYNERLDIFLIIGKLRSQIDHIPWEEADNGK